MNKINAPISQAQFALVFLLSAILFCLALPINSHSKLTSFKKMPHGLTTLSTNVLISTDNNRPTESPEYKLTPHSFQNILLSTHKLLPVVNHEATHIIQKLLQYYLSDIPPPRC